MYCTDTIISPAFQGCSSGILRGCGRQRTSATIVFCGMYLVGLPIGIPLMFLTSLGTAGFWWGTTVAMCIESVAYFVAVMKTDWDKEAEAVRIGSSSPSSGNHLAYPLRKCWLCKFITGSPYHVTCQISHVSLLKPFARKPKKTWQKHPSKYPSGSRVSCGV
jgi:hypothetical protein